MFSLFLSFFFIHVFGKEALAICYQVTYAYDNEGAKHTANFYVPINEAWDEGAEAAALRFTGLSGETKTTQEEVSGGTSKKFFENLKTGVEAAYKGFNEQKNQQFTIPAPSFNIGTASATGGKVTITKKFYFPRSGEGDESRKVVSSNPATFSFAGASDADQTLLRARLTSLMTNHATDASKHTYNNPQLVGFQGTAQEFYGKADDGTFNHRFLRISMSTGYTMWLWMRHTAAGNAFRTWTILNLELPSVPEHQSVQAIIHDEEYSTQYRVAAYGILVLTSVASLVGYKKYCSSKTPMDYMHLEEI